MQLMYLMSCTQLLKPLPLKIEVAACSLKNMYVKIIKVTTSYCEAGRLELDCLKTLEVSYGSCRRDPWMA